eukprot:TRINITY_DN10648_c0_g1_i1.p1 TRINITY_DN10648_c0_g1~~TRINITY_DN10648_c0_g1_i1.p1  ORF type:complete len:453 (-),score=150.12 TRINITY_DN10648_c0_g1_i1:72-1430(-)
MDKLTLNHDRFLSLLSRLVSEGEHLQNQPPKFVPQEVLAARHIQAVLHPHTREQGGSLSVRYVEFTKDRGNLIVEYNAPAEGVPAPDQPVVSFVGSHMDVVMADPARWKRNPFKMVRDEEDPDIIHGRGTTDCLGHCALLTDLFVQLDEKRPSLGGLRVVGVLIADEEAGGNSAVDIGVEALAKHGHLESLKGGPLVWLDCADGQPNIGSGGVVQWELKASGTTTHSGFPHKAVNALEFASDALQDIQAAFYRAFPRHERETEYGFESSSSMKPTRISVPDGSVNQIPGECTVQGDIRLIPFYKIGDAVRVVEEAVAALSCPAAIDALSQRVCAFRGPNSKYRIEGDRHQASGSLHLRWLTAPVQGIACRLDSPGYRALAAATEAVFGRVAPLADTGSLPLVADLQEQGFDVQTVGYGVEDAYHADNEFARISDFAKGFEVLRRMIVALAPE